MHVQISASKPGPLSILEDLPTARLAVLEGLNGIGKTLAIRVLQICTGTLPYRIDSPAWRSLCRGLGELRVSVTDLNGAREIRWSADSRDWLDVKASDQALPFQQITIDGNPGSMDAVRRLLVVHRLAGDEGITETLAQEVDSEGSLVSRWTARYAAQESSPLARLEQALGDALEALGDWPPDRYVHAQQEVWKAEDNAAKASEEAARRVARRDALGEAVSLRRQLEVIDQYIPDLETKLVAIDTTIEETQRERDSIQAEMLDLAGHIAGADTLVRELSNARRTRDRNREHFSEALDLAAAIAADLNIEPTYEAVGNVIDELRGLEDNLNLQQMAIDAAPAMRNLLDRLTDQLSNAEDAGLSNEMAISLVENETKLTVSQTRAGMSTRRAELEGQPPPPQAKEVSERLADVRRRLEKARGASVALDEASRYRRLASGAEDRVDRALDAMDPDSVERLQDLDVQRRSTDEQLFELATRRASLRQQLGGLTGGDSIETVTARLQDILERSGVTIEELDATLEAWQRRVAQAEEDATAAASESQAAKREFARANSEIRRAFVKLASEPTFEWLRRGMAMPQIATNVSAEASVSIMHSMRLTLRAAIARLARYRGQLGGVQRGLTVLSEHLRGRNLSSQEYLDELEVYLGRRFSTWFNIDRVRSELLPRAEGAISIDLHRLQVVWMENGAEAVRPLEAFSSGDQAFAYTRARLGILDEQDQDSLNRLIVLDEFGAFIARDRLAGLMGYLQDRINEHPKDQVLVILPLTQDYSEQAASAVGSEAERLQQLVNEVTANGYAIRELLP